MSDWQALVKRAEAAEAKLAEAEAEMSMVKAERDLARDHVGALLETPMGADRDEWRETARSEMAGRRAAEAEAEANAGLAKQLAEARVLNEVLEKRIKGLHVANDSFGDPVKRVEEQAGELAEARDMATQLVGRELSLRQRVEELERERDPEKLEAWGRGLTQRAEAAEAEVARLHSLWFDSEALAQKRGLENARLTALLDVSERKLGEWRDRGAEVERLRAAAGRVIEAHDDRTIFAPIDALRAALRGGGK